MSEQDLDSKREHNNLVDALIRLEGFIRKHYPKEEWKKGDVVDAAIRVMTEQRAAAAERDHLRGRERDIVTACAVVADGGKYRNDIISAVNNVKHRAQFDGLVQLIEQANSQDEILTVTSLLSRIKPVPVYMGDLLRALHVASRRVSQNIR